MDLKVPGMGTHIDHRGSVSTFRFNKLIVKFSLQLDPRNENCGEFFEIFNTNSQAPLSFEIPFDRPTNRPTAGPSASVRARKRQLAGNKRDQNEGGKSNLRNNGNGLLSTKGTAVVLQYFLSE